MTGVKYITECEQKKKSTKRLSKPFFHTVLQLKELYYDPHSIYTTWPDPHLEERSTMSSHHFLSPYQTTQCHTQLRRTRFEQIQMLEKETLTSDNTAQGSTNQRWHLTNISLRANIFEAISVSTHTSWTRSHSRTGEVRSTLIVYSHKHAAF